ncbi:MAG: MFS transporter [Albidovulum sp.]
MAMMLASLGTSIANIALPTLSIELSAPFGKVQWVVTAYLVALTLSVIVVGHLGDKFGRKGMLLFGLGLFAMASFLCAIAPTLLALVGARLLQGIAAAFLMTLTVALIQETALPSRIGMAMGLLGTTSAIGTALGPALGGFLIAGVGWRGVFFVLVPCAVLCFVFAYQYLPARAGSPVHTAVGPSAYRQSCLLQRMIANACVAATMMATLVVGPFYLNLALGLGTTKIGLVMAVGPMISIFSGIPSGRLVDMWGAQRVIFVGLVAMATGAAALAFLSAVWGLAGYLIAIAILTPGYQLFQAANNTAVMANVPTDQRGAFSGILALSRNLGLVMGAVGLGAIFAFGTRMTALDETDPVSIQFGLQMTFSLAAIMLIAGIYLVRTRR